MKKEEFLAELKRGLGRLPEAEKKEILADYEEHYRMGLSSGRTEEQVSVALGNPRILGKSFLIESMLEEGRGGGSAASVLRAVFASLSLGFFNLIVVLGPFIAFVAVIASLWASAAALALSGIAVLIGLVIQPLLPQFISTAGLSLPFLVFAAIGVSALGALSLLGMWYLTRWFLSSIAKYVQFNLRIITSKR
jgi:uncharacterized membrane protein